MRSNTLMCATGALLALTSTAFAQTANEDQTILPNMPQFEDRFGWEVDIDGDTMVVSSPYADVSTLEDGTAWVYERDASGTWNFVQELFYTNPGVNEFYGWDCAIDGDRIAVGAILDPDAAAGGGAVFVWERSGGVWTETAKLIPTVGAVNQQFGSAVSVSGDRIAVGSWGDNNARGAVYIFDYDPIGMTWSETVKLTAQDGADGDQLGMCIDLDGNRVVSGANLDDNSGQADTGSAYLFEFVPALNQWRVVSKFLPTAPNQNDTYARSVEIEGDYIAIGCAGQDGVGGNSGSVFVYKRASATSWPELTELVPSDTAATQQFGFDLTLDGTRLFVGANGDTGQTGAAYYFERQPDDSFLEVVKMTHSEAMTGDFFGEILDMAGTNMVVSDAFVDVGTTSQAGTLYMLTNGTLFHGQPTVSLSSGGEQQFLIRGGPSVAGQPYIILGSGNGTSPGTLDAASGITIPLNFDSYFLTILNGAGAGLVGPWLGFLDGNGAANAKFGLPAGTSASLAGTQLWHGIITIDVFVTGLLSSASNPVKVTLVL